MDPDPQLEGASIMSSELRQQHHQPLGADNLPSGPGLTLANEQEVVRKAGREAINKFLGQHNCFSVLRASGKVVVFDTRIPIQLAFYALVEHDMQAAPLWDPTICQFVGLLKVTDFIDILRHYKYTSTDVSSLSTRSIAEMIQDPAIVEAVGMKFDFPSADSSATLKEACKVLLQHKNLDFLPVVMPEDMRVLACITYTNILEHLVTHFREQRRLFDDSIYDLNIGTYHDAVVKVGAQQTLAQALDLMHHHQLSAVPVVDLSTNRLLGVYSRSDITFLTRATDAEDAVTNLDLRLQDVLEQQRTDVTTPDAMHTCSTTHTLQAIFEYFAQLRFNRLFVVDEAERLVGVVSAKDLVEYFMID